MRGDVREPAGFVTLTDRGMVLQQEIRAGDTDGDGIRDSVELATGSDPLDASSVNVPVGGRWYLSIVALLVCFSCFWLLRRHALRHAR